MTGYVRCNSIELVCRQPGRRGAALQPVLTGRVTPAGAGCVFTGDVAIRMPGAPVMVTFFGIVGLALIAGVISVLTDVVQGHGRSAVHLLPFVIDAILMLAFARLVVVLSRSTRVAAKDSCGSGWRAGWPDHGHRQHAVRVVACAKTLRVGWVS